MKPALFVEIPQDGKSMEDIEYDAIRVTLVLTMGNRSEAARRLCISRPTLQRKMSAYKIKKGKALWTTYDAALKELRLSA